MDDGHYTLLKKKRDVPTSVMPIKKFECVERMTVIVTMSKSKATLSEGREVT